MFIKAICPHCKQKVEAPKEASGQELNCPTCDRAFVFRKPKSRVVFIVVVIALLSSFAGIEVHQKRQENEERRYHDMIVAAQSFNDHIRTDLINNGHNPNEDPIERFREHDAKFSMMQECTNTVVGLNRIIKMEILDYNDDPNKWTGKMTVEYVNKVGGIEREELSFKFMRHGLDIFAYQDSSPHDVQ